MAEAIDIVLELASFDVSELFCASDVEILELAVSIKVETGLLLFEFKLGLFENLSGLGFEFSDLHLGLTFNLELQGESLGFCLCLTGSLN